MWCVCEGKVGGVAMSVWCGCECECVVLVQETMSVWCCCERVMCLRVCGITMSVVCLRVCGVAMSVVWL